MIHSGQESGWNNDPLNNISFGMGNLYGLIKGFMKFKLTRWGLFILIAPFIILAVLINIRFEI